MERIIKLDRRHLDQLVEVDFLSEHQGSRARRVSRSAMREELLERFRKKQELFFGCKRDDELIGYVTFKPSFPGYHHGEVYWLAVKKTFQGQGIGRKLMAFIELHAKKKGYRKVFLYTGKDMLLTRGFYERIGYSHINEFPGYYGYLTGNTTAVLYGKAL